MAELTSALEQTLGGLGGLWLLSGEPGAGKTRLATEVAAAATGRDARALWGRCSEHSGAPVYWPWTQILRAASRGIDVLTVGAAVGPAASDLAVLAPDLARRLGAEDPPASVDPVAARFRLFDAVAAFLAAVAEARPLLLIFDDLQWADGPSLSLLEFIAREATTLPVMLLAAYRSSEARVAPDLSRALGSIAGVGKTVRVGGLARRETAELVAALGLSLPDEAIERLHARTGGNPFFVDEVARELHATGDNEGRFPIPATVTEAIRLRLRHLPEDAVEALAVAAALGRTFETAHLESVIGVGRGDLAEMLEVAAEAGIFAPAAGQFGVYAFAHDIFREALYTMIPARRREAVHLRFARVLESGYGSRIDDHLGEVAHHFIAAGSDGTLEGLAYASRAGHHAAARSRWDEAAAHFERALRVLDAVPADRAARCAFLLDLSEGLVSAGARERAEPALREAATIAASLDDWDGLVRVANARARFWFFRSRESDERLARARALQEDDGDAESLAGRAVLLAGLARELGRITDPTARRVGEEAAEAARASGDPHALVETLRTRLLLLESPDEVTARLPVAESLLAAAENASDTAAAFEALTWTILSHLELADARGFDAALRAMTSRPAPAGSAAAREAGGVRIMHAILEGRMGEAQHAIASALRSPGSSGSRYDDILVGQVWAVSLARGRIEPLIRHHEREAGLDPEGQRRPAWIANSLARMGRKDEARKMYERSAAGRFLIRKDFAWLSTIMLLADTCAILKDTERAPLLAELLEPYRARFGVFAPSAGPVRPVARDLGILYLTIGRHEEAVAALEEALDCAKRLGARLTGAQCKADLARALRRRGTRGDAERAGQLLAEAFADAASMGLIPAAPQPQPPARQRAVLRPEGGDYWIVGFGAASFRVSDTKAIRCLHLLVANPGREFHVADLVAILEGNGGHPRASAAQAREAGLAPGGAGLGPILDQVAKAAYKDRVEELRGEIAEAEEWGDVERAARAREEIDAIAHQLGAGVGLAGRDRTGPSDADRARVNVTRMIKRAIDSIKTHDPALARHLADSVRRGTYCSYEPDPARPLEWELS